MLETARPPKTFARASILGSLAEAESRWQAAHNSLSEHFAEVARALPSQVQATFLTLPTAVSSALPSLLSLAFNSDAFLTVSSYFSYETSCSLRLCCRNLERCMSPQVLLRTAAAIEAPSRSLHPVVAEALEEVQTLVVRSPLSLQVSVHFKGKTKTLAVDTASTVDQVLRGGLGCKNAEISDVVKLRRAPSAVLLPMGLAAVLLDSDFGNACMMGKRTGGGGSLLATLGATERLFGSMEECLFAEHGCALGGPEAPVEVKMKGGAPAFEEELWRSEGNAVRTGAFGTVDGSGAFQFSGGEGKVGRGKRDGYESLTIGGVVLALFHPRRLRDYFWAVAFVKAFEEAAGGTEHSAQKVLEWGSSSGYCVFLYAILRSVLRACEVVQAKLGEEKLEALRSSGGRDLRDPLRLRALAAVIAGDGLGVDEEGGGEREFERVGIDVEAIKLRFSESIQRLRKKERKKTLEIERKLRLYGAGRKKVDKAKKEAEKEQEDRETYQPASSLSGAARHQSQSTTALINDPLRI